MSAVAVAIWDQGVIVAADGVCTDYETGTIGELASKMIVYPERNAIMAWCGIGNFGHYVHLAIAQKYPTFDALLEAFPDVCSDVHYDMVRDYDLIWQPPDMHNCSIVLAGFSQARQRHEAYRMVSYAKTSTNSVTGEQSKLVPWTMMPIEYVYCSNSPPAEICDEFGLTREDAGQDLAGLAIRFICANRAASGPVEDDGIIGAGRFYSVGGFVQMAYMQQDHLQCWIAHRWPEDVAGERIDPTKGAKVPEYLLPQTNIEQQKAA